MTLLHRLEQATEGNRELDAEIWLAVVPGVTRNALTVNHHTGPYVIDETRDATGRLIIVPSYTTSLDAALTLLPDDFYWMIAKGRSQPAEPLYGMAIYRAEDHGEAAPFAEAEHECREICICIAALRARSSDR